MINKNISKLFLIILLIISPENLLACDLKLFKFGSKFSEFHFKEILHLKISDQEINQEISLPSDNYCSPESNILGGTIKLKFLYMTLVQIKIEINNSKPVIEKWAEKNFGLIDENIKRLKNYQFLWEFDDYDVVYLSELKGSESFEFVEISSLTFNKLFSDYYSLKEIIDDKKK